MTIHLSVVIIMALNFTICHIYCAVAPLVILSFSDTLRDNLRQ